MWYDAFFASTIMVVNKVHAHEMYLYVHFNIRKFELWYICKYILVGLYIKNHTELILWEIDLVA